MKLLFVIKTLAAAGGGAERVLADITAGLASRGHEVTIASFDPPDSVDFYAFDPCVRRLRLGLGRTDQPSGAIMTLRRIVALRRMLRRLRPEVTVGFMHSAYVPLAFALPASGLAGIASEHIVFGHYSDRKLERLLLRFAAWHVRAITAVSDDMRRSFPLAIRRKMVVIANPVRIGRSDGTPPVRGGAKTLLSVGRLESQKDQATLVAAFARVAAIFPDWRLRIVGEGVLRPLLERQVAALGLASRVALPGATADVDAEYRAADLFALPSLYESFGLATAEAMSHGLAAVGFADCPGTNELIADGTTGLLVGGPDRVAALADGLGRLMASPEERARMGAAAPALIGRFAPDRVVERWEAVLEAASNARTMPLLAINAPAFIVGPCRAAAASEGNEMNAINQRQVARNVAVHDRIARRYDAIHGEIFNVVEQDRLGAVLGAARNLVNTSNQPLEALDFGCGSGNLTRHLLNLGMTVTAADVSRGFLDLVASRYPEVTTHWMQGGSTAGLAERGFDFIATYSVLHHIPDYLEACAQLARICRPGGVVLIDHEPSEGFWLGDATYSEFRKAALKADWRKYLSPSNYWHRMRRLFDPRHSNEGDIHVWPDDHVEWPRINALMADHGLEPVIGEDYLLARKLYRPKVYSRYVGRCSDTRVMAFRKFAA